MPAVRNRRARGFGNDRKAGEDDAIVRKNDNQQCREEKRPGVDDDPAERAIIVARGRATVV